MDHKKRKISEVPAGLQTQNLLKLTTIQRTGGILCCLCAITFDNKTLFDEHYKKHDNHTTVYACVVCKKSFNEYPTFRGHCYTKHVMKDQFKCNHCQKLFAKFTNLKEHQALHALNKYKCLPTCGFECATRDELISHKKASKHTPPYFCQLCDFKLNDVTDCRAHFKEHVIFDNICPICTEHITDESHLLEHFANGKYSEFKNAGEMENYVGFLCIHCDSMFTDRNSFETHCLKEHNDVVYACCLCDKQFDDYNRLVAHYYYHTITHDKTKLCVQCNIELTTLAECKEHMQSHKLETYTCPVCGFRCTAKYLTRHTRLHFPVDINVYQVCDKVPIYENAPQTKCVCSLCDESFVLRSDIYSHLTEVHKINGNTIAKREDDFLQSVPIDFDLTTGKRKCTECGKQFNRPCKLKKHMMAHTRAAVNYDCRVCDLTFNKYLVWYRHIKNAHCSLRKKIQNSEIQKIPNSKIQKIQMEPVVKSLDYNTLMIKDKMATKVGNKEIVKSCKNLPKRQMKGVETILIESIDPPLPSDSDVHVPAYGQSPKKSLKPCKERAKCQLTEKKTMSNGILIEKIVIQLKSPKKSLKPCKERAKCQITEEKTMSNGKLIERIVVPLKSPKKSLKPCKEPAKFQLTEKKTMSNSILMEKIVVPLKSPKKLIKPRKCQMTEKKTMSNGKLMKNIDVLLTVCSSQSDAPAIADSLSVADQIEATDNIFTDGYLTMENMIPVQQHEYLNTNIGTKYAELQTVSENTFTGAVEAMQDTEFPREYGPDIIKCTGVKTINLDGQVTDIDEDMPHIDPLLTIKTTEGTCEHCEEIICQKMNLNTKWEPPVITKVCEDNYNLKIYHNTLFPLQT